MTKLPTRIDDTTYKLLRGAPATVALRTRAVEWMMACDADSLDKPDPGPSVRGAERAHRAFLDAALQFAEAVRERGSEHLHLWARSGEVVQLIPLTSDARAWVRAHGIDGKVLMVKYWCEQLTVRSPRDQRRRKTFGPQEATWAKIETEAERVRYERALRAG